METQYGFCEVETDIIYWNFMLRAVNNNFWITAKALRFLDPLSSLKVIDYSFASVKPEAARTSDLINLDLRDVIMSSATKI
jgi:hypothetical protein